MEKDFDSLLAGYLENTIGISEDFLSSELTGQLRQQLLGLHQQKLLSAAGIGQAGGHNHNTGIRSDAIYWLDREHGKSCENDFLDRIDAFIRYLNRSCYAGITGCEFHYSLYEAGSFYKKHLDQFRNNTKRQYSMITYLNADWQPADEGELLVHHESGDQKISPTEGKTVFFKSSELLHEVLVTQKQRISVTGWLKREG
jgi:SM-20-related protein